MERRAGRRGRGRAPGLRDVTEAARGLSESWRGARAADKSWRVCCYAPPVCEWPSACPSFPSSFSCSAPAAPHRRPRRAPRCRPPVSEAGLASAMISSKTACVRTVQVRVRRGIRATRTAEECRRRLPAAATRGSTRRPPVLGARHGAFGVAHAPATIKQETTARRCARAACGAALRGTRDSRTAAACRRVPRASPTPPPAIERRLALVDGQ